MRTINIHQAKTHLSRLVDEAVEGDSFVIAKRGKQMVQVTRLNALPSKGNRLLGSMKGMFTLPDNFDEIDKQLDKEIEKLMLGEDEE
jgi:antitoxin (DNA-binding transcriptional repressor) of toxin-antitoxin stability system